jgi:hypothetical protein
VRKLAFFRRGGDPLKKGILHHAPPFFYGLANNHGSYSEERPQPGKKPQYATVTATSRAISLTWLPTTYSMLLNGMHL